MNVLALRSSMRLMACNGNVKKTLAKQLSDHFYSCMSLSLGYFVFYSGI